MFKREKIQFYTLPPALLLDKTIDDSCWSWDCSFKDLQSSDYVVGQAWVRIGGDFYLLHQIRDRMTFGGTKKSIKAASAKYPSKLAAKLVEDKANGTAVIDDLKSSIPGLIAVEPEGGKETRASVVEPFWEAGNIYVPQNAPWVEEFIQECTEFPKGVYDDQVDAMSQAIVYMSKRMSHKSWAEVSSVTKSTLKWHQPQQWRDPRGE